MKRGFDCASGAFRERTLTSSRGGVKGAVDGGDVGGKEVHEAAGEGERGVGRHTAEVDSWEGGGRSRRGRGGGQKLHNTKLQRGKPPPPPPPPSILRLGRWCLPRCGRRSGVPSDAAAEAENALPEIPFSLPGTESAACEFFKAFLNYYTATSNQAWPCRCAATGNIPTHRVIFSIDSSV